MSAAAAWPPSLRPIGRYLVRAKEVEAVEPLVSYYCNVFALQKAMEIRDKSDPQTTKFIGGLLDKVEAMKPMLQGTEQEHKDQFEDFALSVFGRADDEDRAGNADKETAKTFFAAVCFFEVLEYFGPLEIDTSEKLTYAKWKVADISKALREGRQPQAGPPGGGDMALEGEGGEIPLAPQVGAGMPPAASSSGEYPSQAPQQQPSYPSFQQQTTPTSQKSQAFPTYPSAQDGPFYPVQGNSTPTAPSYPSFHDQSHENPAFQQQQQQQQQPPSQQNIPGYSQQPSFSSFSYPGAGPGPTAPTSQSHLSHQPSYHAPSSQVQAQPPKPIQPTPPPPAQQQPPPQRQQQQPSAQMGGVGGPPQYMYDPTFKPPITAMNQAQKAAKNAASAIDFDDLSTAVAELKKALSLLTRG